MAAKLLLLILVAGATAACLLVIRHERIDTAYEMSRAHRQAMERQRTLWSLRSTIAQRVQPEEIERLMDEVSTDWSTIHDDRSADAASATAPPTPPAPPSDPRRLVVASPGETP